MRLTRDKRISGEVPPLPEAWRRDFAESFKITEKSLGSRTQDQVSFVLNEIGWSHSTEHYDSESGLSLDMAQIPTKTAVEFDGPVHYFANEPWMLTGRSKLKRRLLDLTGWEVVYIDYRDWDSATDKVDCVFKAFAKHGVDPQVAQRDAHLTRALPEAESSADLSNWAAVRPATTHRRPSRRATARASSWTTRRGAAGRRGTNPGVSSRRPTASLRLRCNRTVAGSTSPRRDAAADARRPRFAAATARWRRLQCVTVCYSRGGRESALERCIILDEARYAP